jgi:hypothetical protein
MQKITESDIERLMDLLDENDSTFDTYQQAMIDEFPEIAGFLTQESMDILTDEEYDLMWFLAVVIFTAFQEKYPLDSNIDPERIEELEEQNWTLMNSNEKGNFRDRLNPFYENTHMEDILALLEDSIEPDEDLELSITGREVIFVSCKTVADAMLELVE